MTNLSEKNCESCRTGTPTLEPKMQQDLLNQLDGWEIIEKHHLKKTYHFSDFVSALDWVNKLGGVAEREGHHPDVYLSWGKVELDLWTHKVNGLTESDFILAAKLDAAESPS